MFAICPTALFEAIDRPAKPHKPDNGAFSFLLGASYHIWVRTVYCHWSGVSRPIFVTDKAACAIGCWGHRGAALLTVPSISIYVSTDACVGYIHTYLGRYLMFKVKSVWD